MPKGHLIRCARSLSNGKIIAWYQGRSEFGPRALGNRSILADSRSKELKEFINRTIKNRECFRPFAPSIIESRCSKWFNIQPCQLTELMLVTAHLHESKRRFVPGISHIDGSARVHTVSKEKNELFFNLLLEFEQLTDIPMLLNTSLNRQGEPIVERPEECLDLFLYSDIDCLAIGSFFLTKNRGTGPRI